MSQQAESFTRPPDTSPSQDPTDNHEDDDGDGDDTINMGDDSHA